MTKYTKLALTAAGIAATMACSSTALAQSSDALLNKLVQKGILTEAEAKDLRNESDKNFAKSFNANLGLPDWVSSIKFSGDFRGRMDYMGSDNAIAVDRTRWRYRVRAGVTANLKDNFEVNLTLGSGDGGPLSNNQTLQGNGTKKAIWVDKAYGKWTPIHDGEWTVSSTIGKMGNPFQVTPMEFDPDYTPEGIAIQASHKINDQHSLKFNTAAFVLDEIKLSGNDPYLVGAQAIWNAKWDSKFESSVGISGYAIGGAATNNVSNLSGLHNGNRGNTPGENNYNPYVLSGSVTYKLDSFPLYNGPCPITLGGEFMENPAVSSKNKGFWLGGKLGKSGKRGLWDLSYRYQRLEADAWFDGVVDDDNIAFTEANGASGGIAGGTNIKGHLVKLNYSVTDALTFTLTGYFNDLINANPLGSKSGGTHVMADLMWKF